MDLPVYLLDISEDMNDDAEVDYVALVDKPAIQKNWNAFKNQQRFEVRLAFACLNHLLMPHALRVVFLSLSESES